MILYGKRPHTGHRRSLCSLSVERKIVYYTKSDQHLSIPHYLFLSHETWGRSYLVVWLYNCGQQVTLTPRVMLVRVSYSVIWEAWLLVSQPLLSPVLAPRRSGNSLATLNYQGCFSCNHKPKSHRRSTPWSLRICTSECLWPMQSCTAL